MYASRRPQGLLGLSFLGSGPCGQGECVREPGDGLLTLEQRPKLRGPRGLFLGRQLGLALEWFEGLVDIGPERLLTPRQALGACPGVAGGVRDVAGKAAELDLGAFEPLPCLVKIAALERRHGVVDHVRIEAAAAVLDEGLVDVEREATRVLFEGALRLGQLRERAPLVRRVAGAAGFVALVLGQRVRLPRERVGLVGLTREDVAAKLGRLLEQSVEVVLNRVLLGLELIDGRFATGALGDRLFAPGQVAEPLEVGVAAGQRVKLALEVVEPLDHRGESEVGLAKAVEPPAVLGGAARLVEHGAARLGLNLGDLPRRPGELADRRLGVLGQRAGEELEPVGHAAGLGLAALECLLLGPIPAAIAPLDCVGGIAQLLGLGARLAAAACLIASSLACQPLAFGSASAASTSGSALVTIASEPPGDHVTFGPSGAGRLSATRTR